jgi:hypothetical protein
LGIAVNLVEAAENLMVSGNLDDLAIGKDALELSRHIFPFGRPVEIVEGRRTAAKEEFAKQRHLGVEQF